MTPAQHHNNEMRLAVAGLRETLALPWANPDRLAAEAERLAIAAAQVARIAWTLAKADGACSIADAYIGIPEARRT